VSGWADYRDNNTNHADLVNILQPGETYTLRVFLDARNSDYPVGVRIRLPNETNPYRDFQGTWVEAGKQGYSTVTFIMPSDATASTVFMIRFNQSNTPTQNVGYGKAKLEKGNKATDWTPAPEDVQEQLDEHNTRISTAELKITDSAIVSTVRDSTAYNNDLSGKVGTTEIISKINQSAESITIQASKISLEGLVTANSNFKILTDGSIEAKNGSFSGTITGSTITGGTITGALIRTSAVNDRIELGNNVLQVHSGANKSMEIHRNQIRFYDWAGTTRTEPVGMIYPTRRGGSSN
jgi:hypothetical protein